MQIYHYDAFSVIPNKGNPAGVALQADHLSEDEMLAIAGKVGFNETVFVLESRQADLKLKYYTPGHEINLCGHATVAALFCLKSRGMLGGAREITIETNVGVLPIQLDEAAGRLRVRMKQASPRFAPFHGDVERLMASIGLTIDHWDSKLPIVYGSTGTWTLLIPLRTIDSFSAMKPDNAQFPAILSDNPRASLHPFCIGARHVDAFMHARHFSSPYSGTIEDPVTGTASGVMGAYYLTYVRPELDAIRFAVEQGQEIDRDGRVYVDAIKQDGEGMDIYVSGDAVFVGELTILE